MEIPRRAAQSASMKEKQEAALTVLEPLLEMMSRMLKAGRITDAHERHCLAFMEMELSAIAASLRQPSIRDCGSVSYRWMSWLSSLEVRVIQVRSMVKYLHNEQQLPHSLLRKAIRCFRPISFDSEIPWTTYKLYRDVADDPRLELPSSELVPPPPAQVAEDESGGRGGSRILFTARHESMTEWVLSNYDGDLHKMKPLNDLDSERLLHTTAFGSMDYCPPDNLKLLCDEILTKCKGKPLFIIGMADWLKQHQQQYDSSAVHRAEQVRLLLKQFQQKLSFNYNDELMLSSLYLSMFPQGYVFDKDHLVMKWGEEGMLNKEKEVHFSELVDRNIITPVAENCGLNLDEHEPCQWHVNPFMLKFLASIAADKGLVFTSSTLASAPSGGGNNTRIARRLALHYPDLQLPAMLQQMDLFHTRSLVISGAVDRTTASLDKFAYLVVLDLQGWENLEDEDMLEICKMFMLRYLSVRCTRVRKLPTQIKDNLLTLDLRGTQLRHLPEKIVRLDLLERLLVGGAGAGAGAGSGMINSDQTVLTKIPEAICHLSGLQTLATIDLSEFSASSVQSLGDLKWLEVLAITWSFHQCSDKAYQEALLSSIQRWRNLKSLTIHCGLGCSMEFLGSLSDPPNGLEKFKVTAGRFASIPQWIRGLKHLAFLQITVCKPVPDDIKILADLVKLENLVLGLEFIPQEEMVIESEGFKELQRFCLDCPVPWLTFNPGTMPKLTSLKLKICSGPANVSAVPSGLTNLQSITEVVICYSKWCSNSSSINRTVKVVREQVVEHCNSIDLVINGIQEDIESSDQRKECATGNEIEDYFEAADKELEGTVTRIQSEIEEIKDEIEIHA